LSKVSNTQIANKVANSTMKINKIIWIAASPQCNDLKELLGELTIDQWKSVFPDLDIDDEFYEDADEEELVDFVIYAYKHGFLARIQVAVPFNIRFDEDGDVRSYSSGGMYRLQTIYAETTEELIEKSIKVGEKIFKQEAMDWKKAQEELEGTWKTK